jgi:twitching motility protein PilT
MLGQVLLQRGLISVEQLEWLQKATAHYRAQQAAPASAAAPATTARAPAAAAAPVSQPAAAAPAPQPSAPRPSQLEQREKLAELDPADEPPLEIDFTSIPTLMSPRAQYRKEHRGDVPTAAPRPGAAATAAGPAPTLAALLVEGLRAGASDIHLHAGLAPLARVHGSLTPLGGRPVLTVADTDALARSALGETQRARFERANDIDFACTLPGVGRFRANVYRQQRGVDLVFRAIPAEPPSLAELGLPDTLARFTAFQQGLVLCTGPAGCGKSTTLAALLRRINEERSEHIITVEDPIEFVHQSKRCLVRQRQVMTHTESFARALRAALREDPDVICIGELRDLETISLALSAAETGHLVLGTLHTHNAVRTIDRVLDVFPPGQQSQVRVMFADSLRGVISQRLVRRADGRGRVAALEVLLVNSAVANLIRDEKSFQIRSVMQTQRASGMRLLDDSLRELVAAGTVTREEAQLHAEHPAGIG